MNSLHAFGLMVLVQLTVVTTVAGLAMTLGRRRATLRHTIGVVALGFMLTTPLFTLLLPRANWLGNSTALPASEPKALAAGRLESPIAVSVEAAGHMANESLYPDAPSSGGVRSAATQRSHFRAFLRGDRDTWLARCLNVAACVWAVGIIVLIWRTVAARRQIRFLLSSARPAAIDATTTAAACRGLGLAKLPPVVVSAFAPMPVVLGLRKPVIVLPRQLADEGTSAQLRDVLVHEGAHVLRCDPYFHAAQHLAGLIFWPHPLVHWLNHQIDQAREEICDNYVLNQGDSADYAQTLLDLTEHCSPAAFALSRLGLFSRRWTLEQRVASLLNPARQKTTRASRTMRLAAMLGLASVCGLVGGVGAQGQEDSNQPTAPLQEKSQDQAVAPAQKFQSPAAGSRSTEAASGAAVRAVIRGVCRDQNTKPVPGARLRLLQTSSDMEPPHVIAEGKSDEQGKFSLPARAVRAGDQSASGTWAYVTATAKGHASVVTMVDTSASPGETSVTMANNPGTLSGMVKDASGRLVRGVTVYIPSLPAAPIPDFMSAVTDRHGRFAITDLRRWTPEDIASSSTFLLRHPDYAVTAAQYSAIPQQVNVTLDPPAIVEGRVLDQVTGRGLADVAVSAQGVVESGWHQTRTDAAGRFRMLMNQEYFNIWAEADDRIAIAVRALKVEQGKTYKEVDIRMVRGGTVVGAVLDAEGKPLRPPADRQLYVAHYGPARPSTSAAVTSTVVNGDGTYRLRVAPGRNYVYVMAGSASAIVHVEDGKEVKLNLRAGQRVARLLEAEDKERLLVQKLRDEAHGVRRAGRGDRNRPGR